MSTSITTRQEFIDYTFRSLGAPVIQINVDPQQAEDRLDEALDYMQERHFDFNQRALFVKEITSADINLQYFDVSTFGNAIGAQLKTKSDGSTGYWPVASDIVTVNKAFPTGNAVGDYIFDLRYQLTLFDFSGLETDYTKLSASQYLLIEAYVRIDPDLYPLVWNDRIFKRYYSALLKKQWAQNLMKFSGVPLPGGAQLNAGAIMQDAVRELAEIDTSLLKTMELPVEPFIG